MEAAVSAAESHDMRGQSACVSGGRRLPNTVNELFTARNFRPKIALRSSGWLRYVVKSMLAKFGANLSGFRHLRKNWYPPTGHVVPTMVNDTRLGYT